LVIALSGASPSPALAHGSQDQAHAGDPGCTTGSFPASVPSSAAFMRQEFVPAAADLGAIDVCLSVPSGGNFTLNIRSGTAAAPGTTQATGIGFSDAAVQPKWVSAELDTPIYATPGTTYVIEIVPLPTSQPFDWRATASGGPDGYPAGVSATDAAPVGDFAFRSFRSGDPDLDGMPDVYELANPCLNPNANDGLEYSDFDGINNYTEYLQGTSACDEDTDDDGFNDDPSTSHGINTDQNFDNCVLAANNPQANTDGAPLLNGPLAPGDDITIIKSDAQGNACDADDDNDGVSDAAEAVHPVQGCASATAAINPLDMDTDGDHLTDGWECAWAGPTPSDPANPLSKQTGSGSADADGDRIADLWELRGYNGSAASTDSDGDGCHDMVEIASIDGNKMIGDPDRLAVARRALGIWTPDAAQDYVLDIDKNGVVGDPDRLFVARAALLPAWLPKSCP
jgi:hypothetical protein